MLMTAQSGSRMLLWKPISSSPIGVTCGWMPLLPSGSPMPGVGAITPTPAGAPAGAVAASDLFGFCAVPAGGAGVAAVVWVGALAGACAAAGVSQAAEA